MQKHILYLLPLIFCGCSITEHINVREIPHLIKYQISKEVKRGAKRKVEKRLRKDVHYSYKEYLQDYEKVILLEHDIKETNVIQSDVINIDNKGKIRSPWIEHLPLHGKFSFSINGQMKYSLSEDIYRFRIRYNPFEKYAALYIGIAVYW